MIGAGFLAIRHALANWGRSVVLIAALALVLALPLASRSVVASFEQSLRVRASTVPTVIGAKGSRFDLVFAALHFRRASIGTIPLERYELLRRADDAEAILLHVRFAARDEPIVATSIEYLEFRGLEIDQGRGFARLGEAVVGAEAARRLGVGPGDELASDQIRSYDITAPPSLLMDVVGVLARSGTPDDDAVFVDLETAWVLEGIAHGHADPESVTDDQKLIGRTEEHVALSGALVEHQMITPENIRSFHVHGDRSDLPLTTILVFPESAKAGTILRTRVDASDAAQAIVPERVIEELVAFVVRLRTLIDAIAAVLGVATVALVGLIGFLSYRVRAGEIATLLEIGSSRARVAAIFGLELLALLLIAALIALAISVSAAGLADTLLDRFA